MRNSNPIGFVSDVYTRNGKTYLSLVLNYKELEANALMLGEFIKVRTGTHYHPQNEKYYLGMVTSSRYSPITYDKYREALALGKLNEAELDEHSVKNINFLHYDIVILGEYENQKGQYRFFASTRFVPSLVDIQVHKLSEDELKALINVSLRQEGTGQEQNVLGYLRIGSSLQGIYEKVYKTVNIENFHGRRTANFGKTGFGKSNENKVILTLLKKRYPKMGVLIFDLNGEYASQQSGTTAEGLIEVFRELNMRDQIVWFTNRKINSTDAFFEVHPIKINFFKEPWLAVELAYQRAKLRGEHVPQYLEAAHAGLDPEIGDWCSVPNRMAYVYGTLLKIGLEPHTITVEYSNQKYNLPHDSESLVEELETSLRQSKDTSTGGSRDLYRFAGRFAFLRPLHTKEERQEFFSLSIEKVLQGKVVIVDLPTVRPELVDFLSKRLASRLFDKALERYADKSGDDNLTDALIVIEEAHNLLKDEAGIFYRIAKEGRKYGIGMLYSTQSPSSIPNDILSQTENFLVKHVSSEDDVKALKRAKSAFAEPISDFILNEPVIGLSYVYMEPYQPFPVPVQVRLLREVVDELKDRGES